MQLRMCAGIAAVAAVAAIAAISACKKSSPEGGTGSAASGSSAGGAGGAGSATGSSAAGSATASGSGAAGSGAAGSGTTPASGSGSGSGAGAGSGSGSGSASGSGAGSANATYTKAQFLEDPLCEQVADKIRACVDKPEFVAALDDGADAKQKKINARLRKGVKKWQSSHELCVNTWDMFTYEYSGFLDNPVAFKAPSALSSCGELGTAVKAAGGLVGGDTAN